MFGQACINLTDTAPNVTVKAFVFVVDSFLQRLKTTLYEKHPLQYHRTSGRGNAGYYRCHRPQHPRDARARSESKLANAEEHSNGQGSNPVRQPPPRLRVV